MIIDLHTHIFPDKIAQKTIEHLSNKGGIPPYSDGSANGLIERMTEAGVDISISLPVMTSPSQFDSINRFAIEINEKYKNEQRRIISFGGIHPKCDDIEGKMAFIKESGFLGVKIHPDYQETFIDDEGYLKIITLAKKLDLIVVTHAGVDGGYLGMPVRCTPDRVKDVIAKTGHSKLVLAHLGANEMHSEVIDKLCGMDVYLDTAYVLRFVGEDVFKKILEKHGEDKILFATDSPWSDMKNDIAILKSFSLGKDIEEKILYKNAKKLLGI